MLGSRPLREPLTKGGRRALGRSPLLPWTEAGRDPHLLTIHSISWGGLHHQSCACQVPHLRAGAQGCAGRRASAATHTLLRTAGLLLLRAGWREGSRTENRPLWEPRHSHRDPPSRRQASAASPPPAHPQRFPRSPATPLPRPGVGLPAPLVPPLSRPWPSGAPTPAQTPSALERVHRAQWP